MAVQLRGGRPIAFRTRAYQPPVLIPPAIPPPATTPAVRPWRRVPQRSQSFRPVIEVYALPRIFLLHCSHRMSRWCHPSIPAATDRSGLVGPRALT